MQRGLAPVFVNYTKGWTQVTSDQVYQVRALVRWFSLGTPVSFTAKTGGHDIAEKLLKVSLNITKQSINLLTRILYIAKHCI